MTLRWYTTVVDAAEPQRLASFWAAALGWGLPRSPLLAGEDGVDGVLDAVVRSAVIILSGVRRASVSMLGPKRTLRSGTQSDELIGAVDRAQ